jgi:IS30 family transposase
MTMVERMDIFRLLYVERLKPSAIAAALNRQPSSITRELKKGMDNRMYNPVLAMSGKTIYQLPNHAV